MYTEILTEILHELFITVALLTPKTEIAMSSLDTVA